MKKEICIVTRWPSVCEANKTITVEIERQNADFFEISPSDVHN